ncbi:MAG: YbjN domain-containing protein [Chthoniobacterales bacterium]
MSESSPSHGSSEAFQTLVAHFEANDFRFHAHSDTKSVQLFITGDAVIYNCRVQLTHQDELIQVRIHYPVLARDPKIRPFVAEALARANHGMSIGNFDIDMDTGDINFHLGQVIRGNGLDDEIIGGVFSAGLATADRYFPAIMRVMFAGHTPTDAVYLSELDVHVEAVQDGGAEPVAPQIAEKPASKKPRRSRKDPRLKSTRELPGLFDKKPGDKDGGPARS